MPPIVSPIVSIEQVTKVYRTDHQEVTALRSINLSFEARDFAVLAGPSGSGKSTLLHLIGALDHPTEGRVVAHGRPLGNLSKRDLARYRLFKIGFVFQAYNLIPVLTALENVEYVLLLQGIDAKERRRRSEELLDRVGLKEEKNRRPSEMSGGQQQRVAVARAVAARPELVLADEPTANLDSKSGGSLIDLFRELNESYQTTFILASHDPTVIERAKRLIRLQDGQVVKGF